MPLSAGDKLGAYEILSAIGAGGMGEVYRAKDMKLKRDVALKVLPEAFANNPDRMVRFQREAEVLASLNHPNIAQIYGAEENALVMELVEGENLKGPLPIDAALNYAKQIAEALEAAHEKGIVHRDLKPANVMVTQAGLVKVLDFGLAAVLQGASHSTGHPDASPTLTMRATGAGWIMGTAAYMSPEQASGKQVDKRADIWAFGVVLWEMVTGDRLFEGETMSHTLSNVLRGEIDFSTLPPETPLKIRNLLRRCLDRNLKNRLRDIGEARVLIEDGETEVVTTPPGRHKILPWALAGALLIITIALSVFAYRHASDSTRLLKVSVPLPSKIRWGLAISPDGRRIAVAIDEPNQEGLWVRELDSLAGHLLPGTEHAGFPFWSPDSRFLGFIADGRLKKIDVTGGPAVTLADATASCGGSWSKNGDIVFAPSWNGALFRVSASGGKATSVTSIDPGSTVFSHCAPWFLPDGRHFLYMARTRDAEKNSVYVGDLDSGTGREVLAVNSNAVYAPPGYLLFLRERTLMAQPFDAGAAKATGDPVPLAEQVDRPSTWGMFSSSENGVLLYSSGALASQQVQLTWFDRSGKVTGTVGPRGVINGFAISPGGGTVAFDLADPQKASADIWLHDLAGGTSFPFAPGPRSRVFPVWSPNGSQIAFTNTTKLYQHAVNGAAVDELLDANEARTVKVPTDWSRDGRFLIEERSYDTRQGNGIWVLPMFGDRQPFPYLQTASNSRLGKLSPNGQWLAYQSDETKDPAIYVQAFPILQDKWRVSPGSGEYPRWSRDGKELFYIGGDSKMMAVEVKGGLKFTAEAPKTLFQTRAAGPFDVSKDGRFLMPIPIEQTTATSMNVVINWTAGLKR